jgi:undecaprenyl-diphosphatase
MPRRLRVRAVLSGVTVALAFAAPAAVLAYLVRAESLVVVRADDAAVRLGTHIARSNPPLRDALLVWQEALQARWVNLAAGLLCLWVWRRHGLATRALWAAVTILVAWNLGLAVKFLVQRARPVLDDALTGAPGYSFPSGHATNAAATGLVVVLLVWPLLGRRGRVVAPVAIGAVVLLTGVDRVMLGAHYPSDVVGGIALGVAMAGGSYLGYTRWDPAPTPGDD